MNAQSLSEMVLDLPREQANKKIPTITTTKYVSFKLDFLFCDLRLVLVYPNQQEERVTYKLQGGGIVDIVLISQFSWQSQNLFLAKFGSHHRLESCFWLLRRLNFVLKSTQFR